MRGIEKNVGCLETRMIGRESRERARDVYFYSIRYFAEELKEQYTAATLNKWNVRIYVPWEIS